MKTVIYPGTFDPVTLGHVNIVERARKVFDEVVIACNAGSATKKTLFTLEERLDMLHAAFGDIPSVKIDKFDGLLTSFMDKKNLTTILRGIRTVQDFEYEYQMTIANRMLNERVETVFMLTDSSCGHISSSLIKEIATLGGDITKMVPEKTASWIYKRFPQAENNHD